MLRSQKRVGWTGRLPVPLNISFEQNEPLSNVREALKILISREAITARESFLCLKIVPSRCMSNPAKMGFYRTPVGGRINIDGKEKLIKDNVEARSNKVRIFPQLSWKLFSRQAAFVLAILACHDALVCSDFI